MGESHTDGLADALAELRDIHLPPLSQSEQIGDALVAFGLGLLVAIAAVQVLQWLGHARPQRASETTPPIKDGKATLVALARGAAEQKIKVPPEMRDRLFRPGSEEHIGAFDAELSVARSEAR